MRICYIVTFLTFASGGFAQNYFNNIYSYNGFYTSGHTVIDDGSGYIGYGSTENDTIAQTLYFYKVSYTGELQTLTYFYEPGSFTYSGIEGGAMKKINDGNYIYAYTFEKDSEILGRLIKLDQNLDTIWTQFYNTEWLWTMPFNCYQTSDNGYILVGGVKPAEEELWDFLLIKTDSLGNEEWHQTYGDEWHEYGFNVIQASDGGYVMGGFYFEPGVGHSIDAMVVKTDSLGNEEWTKYFGNPDLNDGFAIVLPYQDSTYNVIFMYGEEEYTPDESQGRICVNRIDHLGNSLISRKFGSIENAIYLRSAKFYGENNILITGNYLKDNLISYILNVSSDLDSIWMREYDYYSNFLDLNFIHDIYSTNNNGIITTGRAIDFESPYVMWMLKLDSLGCETPGCDTTVKISESFVKRDCVLSVFPNPVEDGSVTITLQNTVILSDGTLQCYDIHGRLVHQEQLYPQQGESKLNVQNWQKGIYLAIVYSEGRPVGRVKFVVR